MQKNRPPCKKNDVPIVRVRPIWENHNHIDSKTHTGNLTTLESLNHIKFIGRISLIADPGPRDLFTASMGKASPFLWAILALTQCLTMQLKTLVYMLLQSSCQERFLIRSLLFSHPLYNHSGKNQPPALLEKASEVGLETNTSLHREEKGFGTISLNRTWIPICGTATQLLS